MRNVPTDGIQGKPYLRIMQTWHSLVQCQQKIICHKLLVTKVIEIEIQESQDHTPTNHRKRCEIINTKLQITK